MSCQLAYLSTCISWRVRLKNVIAGGADAAIFVCAANQDKVCPCSVTTSPSSNIAHSYNTLMPYQIYFHSTIFAVLLESKAPPPIPPVPCCAELTLMAGQKTREFSCTANSRHMPTIL